MKRREHNRWSVKSNSTLARNREPDRRYAISSPTSAEERKLDCRFAYTNPTLVQRRQADADLHPTMTTFYRRWFDVTLQTGNTMHSSTKNYLYAYMLGGK